MRLITTAIADLVPKMLSWQPTRKSTSLLQKLPRTTAIPLTSGLSTLAQKRLTFPILVRLYKPQKVKGYLLSPQNKSNHRCLGISGEEKEEVGIRLRIHLGTPVRRYVRSLHNRSIAKLSASADGVDVMSAVILP